jgi:hypothetical protein
VRQVALESEIGGRTSGGIDTHVGHHSSDDELIDSKTPQVFEKRCFPEAVRKVLLEHDFSLEGKDGFMNFGTDRVRQEECRTGTGRDVLDVNDRSGALTKCRKQRFCLDGSGFGSDDLHGAARKVVVLNVDDQERGSHRDLNVRGHRADEMKDATGSAASEAPGGPRC